MRWVCVVWYMVYTSNVCWIILEIFCTSISHSFNLFFFAWELTELAWMEIDYHRLWIRRYNKHHRWTQSHLYFRHIIWSSIIIERIWFLLFWYYFNFSPAKRTVQLRWTHSWLLWTFEPTRSISHCEIIYPFEWIRMQLSFTSHNYCEWFPSSND